jgi:predicted nucleic acid-binding Zn ribbon protein
VTWDSQFTHPDPHPGGCACQVCRNAARERNRVARNTIIMFLIFAAIIGGCAVLVAHR